MKHVHNCAYVGAHISEGDEAALCNCGAYEDAYAAHLADLDDEAQAAHDLGYDGPRERVERVER